MKQQHGPKNIDPEIEELIAFCKEHLVITKARVKQAYRTEINALERALLTFESAVRENCKLNNDVALVFTRGRLIFDTDLWEEFGDELKRKYLRMQTILMNLNLIDPNFWDFVESKMKKP